MTKLSNMNIANLSDRELLIYTYQEVLELKVRLYTIEDDLSILKKGHEKLDITIYGDDKMQVKGLIYHINQLKLFKDKYKKWEFAAGVILGLGGFLWGFYLAIKEIIKLW